MTHVLVVDLNYIQEAGAFNVLLSWAVIDHYLDLKVICAESVCLTICRKLAILNKSTDSFEDDQGKPLSPYKKEPDVRT